MAGARGIVVLLSVVLAAPLYAQDPPIWENKEISAVLGAGFVHESKTSHLARSGLRAGQVLTSDRRDKAVKELFKTGKFDHVDIEVKADPQAPQKVVVTVRVVEYAVVEAVEFNGTNILPPPQLKPNLRLAAGEPLNPFHLKLDRDSIREQYLLKGYAFMTVQDLVRAGTRGGVVLVWNVSEGPLVSVDRIRFSGRITCDEGDLRKYLLTKENDRDPLFGVIPLGNNPFVERNLREDVERIKLFYRLNGWMDIHHGDRVFLKDLEYSDDKSKVVVTFHVDEGPRYRIRSVRFEMDEASRGIFPEAEMRSWLQSRPGDPYVEDTANRDVSRIKARYGERAYILAEVSHQEVLALNTAELDIVIAIRENEKIHVGQLLFEGNTKTREEVLRREFTRTGFVPGEEYNQRSLDRAMQRIRDRSWVEQQGGIGVRTQETDEPNVRDVIVDIREGQTGSVRFAAGYSSAYGLLGLLEYTQKNFDIADLPKSASEMFDGTAFAGGGQFFRARIQPAVQRQSYTLDFREPWFFGHEVGMGTRAYITNTLRESYDDKRVGGELRFDKRIEPWTFQITFQGYTLTVDDVETRAPRGVRELEGENLVFALIPAIIVDTRDSFVIPTEGIRFSLSYEYTGQILPGDFDFNKLTFEGEGHIPLYTTENRLRHVLSSSFTFGWAHGARGMNSVPIVERFYAGGRDGPRGFEFRGMGPHENGDPVGGEALVLATVEYSYPLFTEFLRGAFWYDLGNLTPRIEDLWHDKWRNVVGFGIRFMIPQLGNIPVKLDFGWPLTKESEDERETVTFDIGALF